MQISTRSKENKQDNTSNLKSSSEINIVNPERTNAYIQTLMKQNGPMKHLNDNFKEIPSPIMVSNIHSIFSSDERRKQIMTMVKKMREKQNNSSNKKMLENYGNIPLSPNPYIIEMHSKKNMQKSSSVTKAYEDRYNLNNNDEKNVDNKTNKNYIIDYKKNFIKQNSNDIVNNRKEINDNININIIQTKNDKKNNSYQIDKKKNKSNQALYFTHNNEIYNDNQINNYDNVLTSKDSQISKNSNNVYQKKSVRGEKRHLTPNLNSNNKINNNDFNEQQKDEIINDEDYEIESFKINIINKKKKKKNTTDSFYFAIKPKKKYKKKISIEYKIQSNNFSLVKKNNKYNQYKNKENNLYSGIKIIQFDNGENVFELKLDGSIKLINQKLKEEGITINDKEFKIFDENMLKKEKEKAVEEALNVQENLLKKNDTINDEERENNFELEKEEAIKNALSKQEELFKKEKEELIKLNENKIINALDEQKKVFQENNLKEKEELKNLKDEFKKQSEKIELLQKTLEEREINFFNEKNEAIKNALKEQENNNKNDEKEINSEKKEIDFEKEKEEAIKNALNKQKELLEKEFELKLKLKLEEKEKENENKLKLEIENVLKKQKDEFEKEKEKEINEKINELERKKENEIKEILKEKDEEYLKDKNIIQKNTEENQNKLNTYNNLKVDNKSIHNSNSFSLFKKEKEKPNLIIDKKEKVEYINNGNNKNFEQLTFKDNLIIENKENIEFVNNHNIICNNNLLFSFKKENEFGGSVSIRYDDQEVENSDNKNDENVNIPFKNEITNFEENIKEKEQHHSENKSNNLIQSMQIPSGNIRKMIKKLEEEKERLKNENPYKLTEETIKEEDEQLINTSYSTIIKRTLTSFNPKVEGLIDKKPTINHKKKKPTNSKFGENLLLSESMEINNEKFHDDLRKKSMQLRISSRSSRR